MTGSLLLGVVAATGASASPNPAAVRSAEAGCVPLDPLVTTFSPAATPQEIEGVCSLENSAYDLYSAAHGYPSGDPRTTEIGQYDIVGIMWQLLQEIAYAEDHEPTLVTTDEQGAYQWLQQLVTGYQTLAAQDAVDEYNDDQANPCSYVPPDPSLFSFNAALQPSCGDPPSEESLFSGVETPTYENFVEYGLYDASQTLGLSAAFGGKRYESLGNEEIAESQASWGALLLGAGPSVLSGISPNLLVGLAQGLFPYRRGLLRTKGGQVTRQVRALQEQQEVDAAETKAELSEDGQPADAVIEDVADAGDELLDSGGVEASAGAVAEAAGALSGAFAIIAVAVAVSIQEAALVIKQAEIPGQLQANVTVNSSPADLDVLFSSGGDGYSIGEQVFESQLKLPSPTPPVTAGQPVGAGPATPPSDGTELEVNTFLADGQPIGSTQDVPTVAISSWPLGLDQGSFGAPTESISVDDGMIWHTPSPDDAAAGLSGYLPSGEIHYYDWAGQPDLAFIDGDQFLTLQSPGSSDLGGADMGPGCLDGGCQLADSLQVMGPNGQVQQGSISTSTLTHGGLTEVDAYDPTDGNLTPSSSFDMTLRIAPDTGAPASVDIVNQYGAPANDDVGGNSAPPNGGLVAGQTVDMQDDATNPLGYPETHTWQIETKCAHDPVHPPDTIEGVPVCDGNPDYQTGALGTNEQDLTVCEHNLGISYDCTEDPAFHGDPVDTVTGADASFTWPAAGTYHVRLITTDQYGVTQRSDEDVTVGGLDPTVGLTATPGFVAPSVIGPVANGGGVTVTGCIADPDDAFADPTVSVDWGDGASETQTAESGGDPTLSFAAFGPTTGCASDWSFTATHVYDLTGDGSPQEQVPVTLSVSDGDGGSTVLDRYVDVEFVAPAVFPAITSPATATFTPTALGYFEVTASGSPTPTIGIASGSLPGGVGLEHVDDGSTVITGTPSIDDGGTYPVTLTATNSDGQAAQSFVLNVDVAPQITSAASGTLVLGQAGTLSFAATGFPVPAFSLAGNVPAGLTFHDHGDGTASLTGTPAPGTDGTYPLTLDAASGTADTSQSFTLVVSSFPAITSPDHVSIVSGGAENVFDVTTTGSPPPALSFTGPLPAGLAFADLGDGTAQIWGSTSDVGTFTLTVTAANASGSVTQTLTLDSSATGGPALSFTGCGSGCSLTSSLYDGLPDESAQFREGVAGTLTVTSSDSSSSLAFVGTLPNGLTFTDNGNGTGTLTGTPAAGATGSYSGYLTATGGGLGFLAIDVLGPPVITSASTATFEVGQAAAFTVTTDAVPVAALNEVGALPAGLTFVNNGDGTATLSGTPDPGTQGTSHIEVDATNLMNIAGPAVSQDLTVAVELAPGVTSTSTANLAEGVAGSFTVTTVGTPPPALSVVGTLPPGVTFTDNGDGTATVHGTPEGSTTAAYPVTLTASSPAGIATQTLSVDIGPLPSFLSSPAVTFAVGAGGSADVSASGTPTPRLTESGALPAGLTFVDNGDGTATLSGTPAVGDGGTAVVPVTATDAYGSVVQDVVVTIDEAPAFLGSADVAPSCAATYPGTSNDFDPYSDDQWTLCASGTPAPVLSLVGALPAGVTFTDNGDGSATIEGTPVGPVGAYPLTLDMSNQNGTAEQPIELDADSAPQSLTPSIDTANFVAGQADSYTLTAGGFPVPGFSFAFPGPDWLSLTDNGNGTATFSGTPPLSAAGQTFPTEIFESNDVGNPALQEVDIAVAATPPAAVVGTPYSYDLAADDPGHGFVVTGASQLPAGLGLSSAGVLSGTPTTVGSSTFTVSEVGSGGDVTFPVDLTVGAATHELEVSEFRLIGPTGPEDWFASVENATDVTVPLSGWVLGLTVPGASSPVLIPLGPGSVAPGATVTVAGPDSSLPSTVHVKLVSPLSAAQPGGFEVVAPDGTVTDRAGEVGADPVVIAGTGVPAPTGAAMAAPDAFLRAVADGEPVNTGDDSTDFTFGAVQSPQVVSFTSAPPSNASVDGPSYAPSATGGASGNPVTFVIGAGSTPGACTLNDGAVQFTGLGTCFVGAAQAGSATYLPAVAWQQLTVWLKVPQTISFTSVRPTATIGGPTYTATATGGSSGNPVTFAVGTHSTPGACTVAADLVHFTGPGTCIVTANQRGDPTSSPVYLAAPEARQTIVVNRIVQTVRFTSKDTAGAVVGGASYSLSATGGGSGNPVTFALGPRSTTGACTLDAGVVDFTGVGECDLMAQQAGDADYLAAPTAWQFIAVKAG